MIVSQVRITNHVMYFILIISTRMATLHLGHVDVHEWHDS